MSKRNPRAKWVLPEVINPPKRICFQIQVPDEKYHIAAFLGALYNLTSAIFWADDVDHTAKQVAAVWQDIFDNLSRQCVTEFINTYVGLEDNMPFFREVCEDGVCYLEFQCCPDEWVRLGRADQIPAGSAPGGGSNQPAPGGGTAVNCSQLQANGKIPLATLLNTGDVVSITATGQGNDGTETAWRCPDGTVYSNGNCNSGTEVDTPGDPILTDHMSLILNINGTFYAFTSGSFTVPSGVSNGIGYIQVNDADLTDNSGSYTVCVTITNNQALSWCHILDFTISNYGFIISPGAHGEWVLGTGWRGTDDGFGHPSLRVQSTFASSTFNGIQEIFYTVSNLDGSDADIYRMFLSGSTVFDIDGGHSNGFSGDVHLSSNAASIAADKILFGSDANVGGSITVSKIVIRGNGTDPFSSIPGC